jgi:phosphoglycolate phosphatase
MDEERCSSPVLGDRQRRNGRTRRSRNGRPRSRRRPHRRPNPYVHQVIASAHESGRIVGAVSNNSSRAVNAYLDRHSLSGGIRLVVARTSHDPALLKPSPHLINEAVHGLDADPTSTTLVGDSFTDIEAAHSAEVASIGYANKPGKRERMTQLRAGVVITSIADLALSLRVYRAAPKL